MHTKYILKLVIDIKSKFQHAYIIIIIIIIIIITTTIIKISV